MDTIKDKEDTRFSLHKFFENEAKTKLDYISSQREIRDNGRYILNNVNIYTPELALILSSYKLPAENMDTQEVTILNGIQYLETYIKSFNEGIKYFDAEFAISPDTLYGLNAEKYVRDIHDNYFHKRHTGNFTGWHSVKTHYPPILTHEIISEFGYYSGIVSKVEEMLKRYPNVFQNFDKCEYNLPHQQINTLEEACKGSKEYEIVKAWFIKEKLVDPDTFAWKDRKSGSKNVLAGYLKDLEIRGYSQHLDDIEIQNIAKNSFKFKVGISTIQHIKANIKSEIPPFLTE